jgi:cell wall-active antibiotic response 4TMS protein YvqF
MNRYFLIRRLRWPAALLLCGCILLLKQMGVIEHFWSLFLPLFLITMGVLLLAERMSMTAEGDFPSGYAGSPYQGTGYPAGYPDASASAPAQSATAETTSIVPAHSHDFGNDEGGQS